MTDNGFSLARVELLNWGNFQGYQKFSLHEPSSAGPLFESSAASAILGVNGSGKSTLIDAMMIALLPFEGSVKLGVTNDVEAGTGGGRTIRDYVLGKHSSHSGVVSDPEAIYGRKEGCSFVLLSFFHNRQPGRLVTLGRAWWFQNHKVSETQLAFLSFGDLRLQALCPGGKTPATSKAFRQHLKAERPDVQLFDTMQSYFTALSQALGKISRDDLKILNRAFFVKSISNIDQFIRENMLIEQDSPSLERLMENVRSGQEIALSIETCEAKIASIGRILKELRKLGEIAEARRVVDHRLRLLSLLREWSELRDLLKQQKDIRKEMEGMELQRPAAQRSADEAIERAKAAHARLLADDVDGKLAAIDREIKVFEDKAAWKRKVLEKWSDRAKKLGVKMPGDAKGWGRFLSELDEKIKSGRDEITVVSEQTELLRQQKYDLDGRTSELREELKHVSQNKTLIPRELHEIKERAVKDLKLHPHQLMFVGELIQVKQGSSSSRKAIESVLHPIARNLLCHPEALHSFTRWLDAEGLRFDVTAKRITTEELEAPLDDEPDTASLKASSILKMIELRTAKDHPFSTYLWKWLRSTFDYELVDFKRFKSSEGKLVTESGLVKKDGRTMRKLKEKSPFSLGWDNADMIEKMTAELLGLNSEHSRLTSQIAEKNKALTYCEDRDRLYAEIQEGHDAVGDWEADVSGARSLKEERRKLLEENPDYEELRRQVGKLQGEADGLARALLVLESMLKSKDDLLAKVEGLIPSREKDLKGSSLYTELRDELGGEAPLEAAVGELEKSLSDKGVSRLQFEGELKQESQRLEQARGKAISMAAVNLGNYRHNFNDPNLPYDLAGDFSVDAFLGEWTAVEQRLAGTDLPAAQEKWRRFFDQVLLDSVKDTINEIKSRVHEVGETIVSINGVLKLTNFEDLPTEQRYLRIDLRASEDERIRKFRKGMVAVEKVLSPAIRGKVETQSQTVMAALTPFVEELQKDPAYRVFVTDVRNHFQFAVQSLRRGTGEQDDALVEVFSGSRKDAKSSAQTTQLAYALLASCLAYRFRFHDSVGGADTPRLIIFDEFGGKFDNEKPRDILKLLDKMGFQSVLVSPMSKADLLADGISHLVLVHKVSASQSKVQSYRLTSRADYERLLASVQAPPLERTAGATIA